MEYINVDVQRVIDALPEWAGEFHNMCKLTEETGELAECIFKHLSPSHRVEEIADVILCAIMDMKWCGAEIDELQVALERKLKRAEDRTNAQ